MNPQSNPNVCRNALPIGALIEEYRIIKILGHGGFGITYYAVDRYIGKKVAIKEFLPQGYAIRHLNLTVMAKSTKDEEAYVHGLKEFLSEAKKLGKFKHHNIVEVIRFIKANNTAYLVMEYSAGLTLEELAIKYKQPLPQSLIIDIFCHVLDGLRAVHEKGMLHRDLKPSNIYLPNRSSPKLIDFGAARYAVGESTRSLDVVLSPGYAPFEQYSRRGKQGPWTDLYGIGAGLFYCMTGKAPINAIDRSNALLNGEEDPFQPVGKLTSGEYSRELAELVDMSLSFKAGNRPQSVDEFLNLFKKVRKQKQPNRQYPPYASVTQGVINKKSQSNRNAKITLKISDVPNGHQLWSFIPWVIGILLILLIIGLAIAGYNGKQSKNNVQILSDRRARLQHQQDSQRQEQKEQVRQQEANKQQRQIAERKENNPTKNIRRTENRNGMEEVVVSNNDFDLKNQLLNRLIFPLSKENIDDVRNSLEQLRLNYPEDRQVENAIYKYEVGYCQQISEKLDFHIDWLAIEEMIDLWPGESSCIQGNRKAVSILKKISEVDTTMRKFYENGEWVKALQKLGEINKYRRYIIENSFQSVEISIKKNRANSAFSSLRKLPKLEFDKSAMKKLGNKLQQY